MKIDNMDFDEKHYAGWKEEDFIADQLASVQDIYGSDDNKKAFLKLAFARIKPNAKSVEKPKAKGD